MLNRVFQVALRVSNRQGRTSRQSNSTTKSFSRTPRSSSSPSAVYSRLRLISFATRLMSKFARKRQNSERASRRHTITLSRILRRRSRPKEPIRTSSAPSETKKHGRRRFETRHLRFWSTGMRTGRLSPVDWIWVFGAARLIRKRWHAPRTEPPNPRFGYGIRRATKVAPPNRQSRSRSRSWQASGSWDL